MLQVPGTRPPFGAGVVGLRPWSAFTPHDLVLCYPMPPWVAQRLNDHPQPSVGGALRDPLPLPFTAAEVRKALVDVWRASRHPLNRWCTNVDPASVRIALTVLDILQARNQGWISFGRSTVNLRCVVYRLVGKPLPPVHDWCNVAPPPARRVYGINDVQTTFDPEATLEFADLSGSPYDRFYLPATVPDAPGGEGARARPEGLIGHDIEEAPTAAPDPFTYSLFEVSDVYDIKGG